MEWFLETNEKGGHNKMSLLPKNIKQTKNGSYILTDGAGKKWNLDEIYGVIEETREKEDQEFEEYANKISQTIPAKDRLTTVRKIFCKSCRNFPSSKKIFRKNMF